MKSAQFSVAILSQLEEVVEQLSNDSYCNNMEVFSGASIGQHIRHILEFYHCIIEQKNAKELCYDTRKRDVALEENKTTALKFIKAIKEGLKSFSQDSDLVLISMLQDTELKTPSSLSRELLYALEHAVHHMAIIKIGLLIGCPKIQIPKNFGVADSTIQYRDQCAQ